MGNYNKQLGLVVVLNFVLTFRLASQQQQVTYWNMETFATSSSLTFFGILPNVALMLTYSHSSAANAVHSTTHTCELRSDHYYGLILAKHHKQQLLYTKCEFVRLITHNAVKHQIISKH